MSYIISLSAAEIERRLLKSVDIVYSAVNTKADATIQIDTVTTHLIETGSELKFRAPVDSTSIKQLYVQYYDLANNKDEKLTKSFIFVDSTGNAIRETNSLFNKDTIVTVILDFDTTLADNSGAAFIQGVTATGNINEDQLAPLINHIADLNNPHNIDCATIGAATEAYVQDMVESLIGYGTEDPGIDTTSKFYFKYDIK